MTKIINGKLHSQNGASFLFAMIIFLVASMVSVTIVTAAVSSVKRVHDDQKTQQTFLTLTSAAQLVRDEMENTKYITKIVSKNDETGNVQEISRTSTIEGTFGEEVKKAIESINPASPFYESQQKAIVVEVEGLDMQPVNVSFVMKPDGDIKYQVVFSLSMGNSDEMLFLTMSSYEQEVDKGIDGSGRTIETTVGWENSRISSLGEI